ncbi:hypothetical protein AC578_1487 [Pseudocercospora eumusae]|uniref:Uncharacterized protein n=1 Tax=Pseudocercospora eumusae TaxID=321146 RepID=A0A139H5E8_9PEZI|nr:hypothetical protein AC578_1487 [Pseudocercospora eumusae]
MTDHRPTEPYSTAERSRSPQPLLHLFSLPPAQAKWGHTAKRPRREDVFKLVKGGEQKIGNRNILAGVDTWKVQNQRPMLFAPGSLGYKFLPIQPTAVAYGSSV